MKKVVIFPGRFQPMLNHHVEVYNYLQAQFPDSEVYVATTDKVDGGRSPFNFQEKQQIIVSLGISADKILQVRRPYFKDDYTPFFDESKTIIVFAIGEKDVDRFPFDNVSPKTGIDMGKKGENVPKYFQKINTYSTDPRPMAERGYITVVPTIGSEGADVASARAFRSSIINAPDVEAAKEIVEKEYGQYNETIFNLLYQKIKGIAGMKENEDVLEGLFSAYNTALAETANVDEDKAHGETCSDCEGEGCKTCDFTGYDALPTWDAKTERKLGESAEEKTMNTDIARMRHLAGLTEAPVVFNHSQVDAISPKDKRLATQRSANALTSDPSTVTFSPALLSHRKTSVANIFPPDTDFSDPEVKKQSFIKAIQTAPGALFGEINSRLSTDSNGLAVSDRLTDIIHKFDNGGNINTLEPDEKSFAMSLAVNAMKNMDLERATSKDAEPEVSTADDEEDDDFDSDALMTDMGDDDEFGESAYSDDDEECGQCHGTGIMGSGADHDGANMDFECKKCNGTGYLDGRHREGNSGDYYGDDVNESEEDDLEEAKEETYEDAFAMMKFMAGLK